MSWWPFRAQEIPASIRERLQDVEDTLKTLKLESKAIRMEWENVYDKVMTATSKLNARARAAQKANENGQEGHENGEVKPQTLNLYDGGVHGILQARRRGVLSGR